MKKISVECRIKRDLGLSSAGLKALAKAVSRGGSANGKGFGVSEAGAREKLFRQGYLVDTGMGAVITDAGRAAIARARDLGW